MTTTQETWIGSAERVGNSRYGNPTWLLHTAAGDYLTAPDSACAYDVPRLTEYGKVPTVTLTVNAHGKVVRIDAAGDSQWLATLADAQ